MINFFRQNLQSLQFRLTLIVLIIATGLVIGAHSVYINQLEIKQSITENTKQRALILEKKNTIQTEVIESYKTLDAFLLDPRNVIVQDWMFSSLERAIASTKELVGTDWVKEKNTVQLVESIYLTLINLKQEMGHLTEIRRNPNKQYPSLKIATKTMRPGQVIFINAMSIALKDIEDSNLSFDVYRDLINIRYFWSQLISSFQIYLANQFGSFDVVSLNEQEQAISVQYKKILDLIDTLQQRDKSELSADVISALSLMHHALDQWHDAFYKIKDIHNSEKWRIDLNLLKTKIQPLLDEVSYLLGLFDDELHSSEEQDKALISKIINNQLILLFGVSLVSVILMAGFLLVVKLVVFKPIGHVTSAIKEEATGFSTRLLPQAYSSEAKALVDAFNEMRKQIHIRQDDLSFQAHHDSLTKLPNRKYFVDQLSYHLGNAADTDDNLTVLLIDLNGFKDINDTLGHQIGDKLLIQVGRRLIESLGEEEVMARLGGDEFAILLPRKNQKNAIATIEKIQQSMDEKFIIDGINTYIGMSIGAAIYPDHGDDENILIRHADIAMYVSKRQKLSYAFYKSSDDSYTLNRLSIIHDIKNSIDHKGLVLYFQPKLNVQTNEIESVEALLRWHHPDLGLVLPDDFIAIAEQSGFINQISYWAIEEALIKLQRWKERGHDIKIAINLSVYNLFDAEFASVVKEITRKYKSVSSNLIFEITETAMMTNPKMAISNLNRLRAFGIKLSIDDYGTGFSSLSYLSQLALNELKIDKSFILNMLNDDRKSIIVQSTIDLAHKLGLDVVAEGVENKEVLLKLKQYGCNMVQGYLVSKPLPEERFLIWMKSYQAELSEVI